MKKDLDKRELIIPIILQFQKTCHLEFDLTLLLALNMTLNL